MSLNLAPKLLAEYRADMVLAKCARNACPSCNEVNDWGDPEGPCARHSGRCVGCGSEDVVERDAHEYADKVYAYWCAACCSREPRDLDTSDIQPFERGERFQ